MLLLSDDPDETKIIYLDVFQLNEGSKDNHINPVFWIWSGKGSAVTIIQSVYDEWVFTESCSGRK